MTDINPTPEPRPEDEESQAWVPDEDTPAETPPPASTPYVEPERDRVPDPLFGAKASPEPDAEPMPEPTPLPGAGGAAASMPPRTPAEPLSPEDERTWAMLAHLSVLLNLVTGFLGPLAALLIYLVYRDRSRYVAFQSMQSFVFQLVWWVGGGILAAVAWTISGILAAILIGCLLMPIALLISLLPLAALVYGVIGAVETNQGRDFRYWLIGDWVRGMLQ